MPVREIIQIDENKCDGCGKCVSACAEGAIAMINGKAKLVSDIYCDGLGACIGKCPQGAITIEKREATAYDETAVHEHLRKIQGVRPLTTPVHPQPLQPAHAAHGGGCPGSAMRMMRPTVSASNSDSPTDSALSHWPVQLALVNPQAPFLQGADILVCADCVPFAVSDFHSRYLAGRAVLVGCPKLDNLEMYREKLAMMFRHNQPRRITVLRMEVPCCGGIAQAAVEARNWAAPHVPLEIHTIGIQGGVQQVQSIGSPSVAASM